MKFRHITRQFTRTATYSRLSTVSHRPSLYNIDSHYFSSNLDNDKNNIVPPQSSKTETISKMSESIQQRMKNTNINLNNHSFWSLTALDTTHKQWINTYNKTLLKHNGLFNYYTIHSFNDITKYMSYIGMNIWDFILRFRMRGLCKHIICYEEFMSGVIPSFKSLQLLNEMDKIKISKCFDTKLYDSIPDIKYALFNYNENIKYNIENIKIFGSSLKFYEQVGQSPNRPDVEMYFNIRYYYELRNKKDENVLRKYADIEWKGLFHPIIENDEVKTFVLNDKGFLIYDVEVDEF